ncbi:MAG TPA: glycosyl hydrolase family 18 protein [Bacillota bacterium]|nr:glycosyl hydrolase family 18 protein [Bacillota bacterium]HOL09508.1 glycosyl hydrolase family 18 protein [Bacillota bacterium]HPO97530.1 glycosyl hydrolase family 18 protein [Bacillota bacterium]
MQGNLLTTILALLVYLASGIFGGNSAQSSDPASKTPVNTNTQQLYPFTGTVNAAQVALRSDPSSNGKVVETIKQDTNLLVLDEQNGWLFVQTDTDQKGWIARWLVDAKRNTAFTANSKKIIAGYYVESYTNDPTGLRSLSQNISTINMIIPFSYNIDNNGNIKGNHHQKTVSYAKTAGITTLALINNIQSGNFSSNTIGKMLGSPSARTKAVNNILKLLLEKGYQGVNIDFENVPAGYRSHLTAFFRELAAVLQPRGLLVTASVPAKTYDDQKSPHSGAFDFPALAPYLDQVMIMAYDQHYSGGPPGPVASYPWVERVINYTLKSFPANKVVLGLAGYGYDWTNHSGKARNYNAIQEIIKKYNVSPKWHSEYKVPYFQYKSWGTTHQVWYENSHSTAAKMTLVKKYNLRGVALWRLGYEDPQVWKVIQQGFH